MHAAVARMDLELVPFAGPHFGNEQLPDAGRADRAHRVQATIPGDEIAPHRHGAGRRRPDRERSPGGAAMVRRMRAEPFPDALVPAFGGKMAGLLAEGGLEAVRVAQREGLPARILRLDEVPEQLGAIVEARLEDAAAP